MYKYYQEVTNNILKKTQSLKLPSYYIDEEIEFLKNLIKCPTIKLSVLIYLVYYYFFTWTCFFFTSLHQKVCFLLLKHSIYT